MQLASPRLPTAHTYRYVASSSGRLAEFIEIATLSMRLLLLFLSAAAAAAAVERLPRVSGCPTSCVNSSGGDAGPCQPGREYCGAAFDASTPQFHVRSASCGENDP